MTELFKKHSSELSDVVGNLREYHRQVARVVRQLKEAFAGGKKVLIAGNGGSAAQAQHFSDEMVGRYRQDRPAYPVVALTADSAVLTCVANDYGYDYVFSRQIEALGTPGDIFVGLTTSGASENILKAAERARQQGMTIVSLTGEQGTFKDMADFPVIVPSQTGARIQELHLHAIHLICEAFEAAK